MCIVICRDFNGILAHAKNKNKQCSIQNKIHLMHCMHCGK